MMRESIVSPENIEQRIFFLRGRKVMLSVDLSELYEVEPRVLIQTVKRNKERFPEDFMFQLTESEFEILKSQIVISSQFKVVFDALRQLMVPQQKPAKKIGFMRDESK
jgi:hypothetical protein